MTGRGVESGNQEARKGEENKEGRKGWAVRISEPINLFLLS
jgi:hypothetical protein